MYEQEQRRLLQLVNSVEKEERAEQVEALLDRERLRRQLFSDFDPEDGNEDTPIEREGSDESEDEVEVQNEDTASEVSMEDMEERNENIENLNIDERLDNVTDVIEEIINRYTAEGRENVANMVVDNANQNELNAANGRANVYENYILGKDGVTKWNTHMDNANLRGRIRQCNIIRGERSGVRLPCPRGEARTVKTPIESWKLFFSDELIDHIVECTNIWIDKNKASYARTRYAKSTNKDEILAVLGLLYLAGLHKASHTNLDDLWSSDGFGVEYFRATMSIKRFRFLLRALRFDDVRTRMQRRAADKLAPIRQVFQDFVNRCMRLYSLSAYVTIDEMLEAFRGKCSFRQYIPNKPARYGLKLYALCDSRTYYTANLEVYAGKQPSPEFRLSNTAADITLRLIEPISGSGRHLTVDNYYGSVPLAQQLLHNHRITMVSTLRKNKREIPPVFIDKKARPPCTSLFAYKEDVTITSYTPNKTKCVVLISTLHHSDGIDESTGDKQKPEILTCYNKYKGGVDTVDQMKGAYSVSRKSNRWPLTLFFSLLNIGGINSFIILRNNINHVSNRRDFLKSIVKDLCKNHLIYRASLPKIPVTLKGRLRELTQDTAAEPVPQEEDPHRPRTGRCYLCGRKKNRKSSTRCAKCQYFVCREHTQFSCNQCVNGEQVSSSEDDDDV